MDDQVTGSAADTDSDETGRSASVSVFADPGPAHLAEPDTGTGEPRRRRRWPYVVAGIPIVVLALASIAWAVDTSSGGVARNVNLAGEKVGGLSEAELTRQIASMAQSYADTPIEIESEGAVYTTSAGEIGLAVDEDATAEHVLDVGSDTFVLLRPLDWVRSFVVERDAGLSFLVNEDQVSTRIVELEGDDRTPPTEPTVELVEGSFQVVPGVDGVGIDPQALAAELRTAAARTEPGEPVRVTVEPGPVPPLGSDEVARQAAARAESLVGEPVEVVTDGGTRTIPAEELRTWVVLASQPDGTVEVDFDPLKAALSLRNHFADIEGHPVNATFTLDGDRPVIIGDKPGRVCCGPDGPSRILAALRADQRTVELDLVDGEAMFTTAQAKEWGITQAVGGNHAWRDGAPTTAAPGFTTYHAPTGARIVNIHRIADLVRGAVVPPGGTFSINDYVGRRTTEKGFVPAGAIANGMHVDEVGGGISQFATTTFNAAYFAGLDIVEYQAHSEYFDRYPRGREATMGFPAPDLKFKNNTPYGIMIWTSYTDSSLTVTLYSTPYATAEQTGIRESSDGACTVVVTTRTRTFPDGHTEDDTFRARYRPGEGRSC